MTNLGKIIRNFCMIGAVTAGVAGIGGLVYLTAPKEISKPTQETYSDLGKDIYVPFNGWCKMENTDANLDIDIVYRLFHKTNDAILVAPNFFNKSKWGIHHYTVRGVAHRMTPKMQELLTDISEKQKAFAFEYHNYLYRKQELKKAHDSVGEK